MGEAMLIIFVLLLLSSGFFLMPRLDRFIEENRAAIKDESETKQPSRVMLTEELSPEEIADEIARFKSLHRNIRVILYDSSDTAAKEGAEYNDKKQ